MLGPFLFSGLFIMAGLTIWFFKPTISVNWAVGDATDYHFPVINYMIVHGVGFGYPDRLAMLPGMHAMVAEAARLLGLGVLSPADGGAFWLQSVFALWFTIAVAACLATHARPTSWCVAPLLASSSYPLFSWVWSTTDLPALAAYATLLALLMRIELRSRLPGWGITLMFGALVLVGSGFRQSWAILSLSYPLLVVSIVPVRSWASPAGSARLAAPLLAGGCAVVFCLWLWGGLVPPSFRQHSTGGALNFIALLHAIAFTGLIGFPFVFIGARQVSGATGLWRDPLVAFLAFGSIAAGVATAMLAPMNPSPDAGRMYSIVWTLQDAAATWAGRLGADTFVAGTMAAGTLVWAIVGVLCIRQRRVAPEIVLLCVYLLSLAAQQYSWQRYVEFPLLLTLCVFFTRRAIPQVSQAAVAAWGAAYLTLSILRGLA